MNKIVINNREEGDLIKQIIKYEPQLNYNLIKTALRKKDVKVNGVKINKTQQLSGGEEIEIFLQMPKAKEIQVVFEDKNFLIINKLAGLEVTIKDKVFLNSKCVEEIYAPYKAVHRLDKNTEGMLILAKNEDAFNNMVEGFKNRSIIKHYTALVVGKPKPDSANLVDYLVKNENEVKIYSKEQPNSFLVKTDYELLETNGETSLLKINLITGKTHQIRAHLAHYDIFVVGDDKYGKKEINKKFHTHKQCLCASFLSFNFGNNNPLNYLNNFAFEVKPSFHLMTLTKIKK